MNAKVYGVDGTVAEEIVLPETFSESYRPDIVRKAVTAMRANRRQPYGVEATAGKKKPDKQWGKKINKKEMALARRSALAAVGNADIVRQRGHVFDDDISLPLILSNDFESLNKTKDIVSALVHIGVYVDVERAKKGKHVRAGKGKRRGRRYKVPKSLLIVVSNTGTLKKAAANLVGVNIITPSEINVEHLAPGGDAGRLTAFTVNALHAMEEQK